MIEFMWPQTNGEWLAWLSALAMAGAGFWMLVFPRFWLSLFKPVPIDSTAGAKYLIRGPVAGGYFGLGVAILALHPQPLLYIAFASMMFFVTLTHLAALVVLRISAISAWIVLIIEGLMTFFPFAYAFGIIA